MTTFIRATEVWVPSADGSLLEFGGGLFGAAAGFRRISQDMCFGRGEGLPGRAWDEGRPILLKEFKGSYFRRTQEAHAAGLHCAVAMPVFLGERLTAVLVFFCGDPKALGGAIELWRNDAREPGQLTLVDGLYGESANALEAASRGMALPSGAGLPGLAWQRGEAVFLDGLGSATSFLRADPAAQSGLDRGLALPCATRTSEAQAGGADSHVLAFFSGQAAPLAARIECWAPGRAGTQLKRLFAFGAGAEAAEGPAERIELEAGGHPIAQAHLSGKPVLREGEPSSAPAGLSLLAIPIVSDGAVTETVALYLG